MSNYFIICFDEYCSRCKHCSEEVTEHSACEECLNCPAREDTQEPLNYVGSDVSEST